MRVTPVLCFFLLLFIVLMYSAYGSTPTVKTAHARKQPKEHAVMYGMINRSSKLENQRRYPGLHVVQHGITMKGSKAVKGGQSHPRGHRNNANSLSTKHSSLFMAAFRHLLLGLLLVICFY